MKKSIILLLTIQIVFLCTTVSFVVYEESNNDFIIFKIFFVILNIAVYVVTMFFIVSIIRKEPKKVSDEDRKQILSKVSSVLSHELRTSLTVIIGNSQVLENLVNTTDEEIKKRWCTLHDALFEMNDKIDELLKGLKSEKPNFLKKDP